jgi:long-chain acyl-CoA synthetase
LTQRSEDLITPQEARTLDGLFALRVRRSSNRRAYQSYDRKAGQWRELTWHDMALEVSRWRSAFASESLQAGDRVAIVLRNCPEWVMFDQAAMMQGLVTVPLYTDDRGDNAAYVLQDAAAKLLLVQDAGRWKRLSEALGNLPYPQRVVILESSKEAGRVAEADERVVTARQWLPVAGPELIQREADTDELATIVYTSGTTGRPKGVMLSHRNILCNAQGGLKVLRAFPEDVFLSFMPLSHTLERTASYYLPMMAGSRVAYARSIGQLAEDLRTIRPTIMIAVPRVFERVYQRLLDQIKGRPAVVQRMFGLAVKTGWRKFERDQGRAGWHPLLLVWPFLRRKVADQVLDRLGGRLRATVSGGAALPQEVARLFIGLGLPLVQGYGLTETGPVISVNPIDDNDPASVGPPLDCVEARIGGDDELLVKGPCNMLGYWNNHAATANIIDRDGWLRTGDQARIVDRHIYITGRIKDILVLSNGEKVPPADMEMAIGLDPLFDQVLVVGEGRSFLSALLVLNADLWPGLAREYGLDPDGHESLEDSRLLRDMLGRIRQSLRDFPGYAKIRRATLLLEPWTVDNGLMTPTLKIKRAQVLKHHGRAVECMYDLDG